jgi:hypothetical protein
VAGSKFPLAIWTWEGVYAASWGHHDPMIFLAALELDHGIKGAFALQGFARVGFDGEGGRCIYNVRGPGRGVRPITEWSRFI